MRAIRVISETCKQVKQPLPSFHIATFSRIRQGCQLLGVTGHPHRRPVYTSGMKLLHNFAVQFSLFVASLVAGAIVFGIPAAYFGWWFWPSIGVAAIVVLIFFGRPRSLPTPHDIPSRSGR
jgi:hypothetical protein